MSLTNREIMITKNGKPLYAICLNPNEDSDKNYIYVDKGEVVFGSSWLRSIIEFSVSDQSHTIAKEIFVTGIQAAVKIKIMELKQLESILGDIDLKGVLGNVMVDNARALLEVKNSIDDVKEKVMKVEEKCITSLDVVESVETAIDKNIKPIARKKASTKMVKSVKSENK